MSEQINILMAKVFLVGVLLVGPALILSTTLGAVLWAGLGLLALVMFALNIWSL